jgi:glucose-1-phosphate adenylyltransferase
MVSGGCIVSGSTLEQCLLFTGVHTHSFVSLKGVVAMPHSRFMRKADLTNVIVDRGVVIPEGLVVGKDPELDAKRFRRTENGICLITEHMIEKLDL